MSRRIPLAPVEGWLTLALAFLICLTLALALDDARWVLGRDTFLDYLPWAAAGGVMSGFIGAKVGWGRWLTYLIGALFAALIVPLFAGSIAFPGGAPLDQLFTATAASAVGFWVDVVVLGQTTTSQFIHFVYAIGLFVWGTSMFVSYATFGHRRPLNGVAVVGVVLVGNIALTRNDQLPYLILFSLASLFLLIRAHAFDERAEWVRRRIGDPASISSVYLRGGTVFIAVAVVGSYLLTQTAASKPLAGAWGGIGDGLVSISRSFSRFLPSGGSSKSFGVKFGSSSAVQSVWNSDATVAFTVQRSPTDVGEYYYRAYAYDDIGLNGWSISKDPTVVTGPANVPLFKDRADVADPVGMHVFTFTISPGDYSEGRILSPMTPVAVSEETRLTLVEGDYYATLERDGTSGVYTVRSLVPVVGNDAGQLNVSVLRAAGTQYPQAIRDRYLGVAAGALDEPEARALEAKIVAEADGSTPIDLADQLVKELHSDRYQYKTDISGVDCSGLSTVGCFARYKQGFCQYYAATMAVILRDLGVPTRIVEGFLPGQRDLATGVETIRNLNAHAWVEVYFPSHGWVTFDPTGGGLSQTAPLPSGRPVASGAPRPSGSASGATQRPERTPRDNEPNDPRAGIGPIDRGSVGPLIAVTILLLLMVGGLAFVAWLRGPRGATSADGAYGTVLRLASRFGFGPQPSQTVYEYAGALGDLLPIARPELETVAQAKVEAVYGRRILGEERLVSLRVAQRQLRVTLLRLAFRRTERRRRR